MEVNVRKPYHRTRVYTVNDGESVTDTSFGNDTDINKIVAKCTRTGIWPEPPPEQAYADVCGLQKDLTTLIEDSREALKAADQAEREARQKAINERTEELKREKQEYEKMKAWYDKYQAEQGIAKPVDGN